MCDCVRLLRDPGGALGDYTRARHDRALNNASSTIRGSQLGENDEENARCNGRRLFVAIGIASAAGPPEQKEGLRSIHRQSIDNSGNQKTESSLTICRSHAYDAYTLSLVKNKKVGRTTLKEDWQGSNYSAESRCLVAGTAVDSKGTVRYTGDTSAYSKTHATYAPSARRHQ